MFISTSLFVYKVFPIFLFFLSMTVFKKEGKVLQSTKRKSTVIKKCTQSSENGKGHSLAFEIDTVRHSKSAQLGIRKVHSLAPKKGALRNSTVFDRESERFPTNSTVPANEHQVRLLKKYGVQYVRLSMMPVFDFSRLSTCSLPE